MFTSAVGLLMTGGYGGFMLKWYCALSIWCLQDAPAAASQPSPAEDKGQQADTTSSLASPFAAASHPYGDLRCGFAADAPEQQQQQQEPVQQLSLPSLQQAEQLLLRQLPRGGQDGGAADAQQLQEWRQRWSAVAPSVAGLEQLASATSMQYMDAQGVCLGPYHWMLRGSATRGVVLHTLMLAGLCASLSLRLQVPWGRSLLGLCDS